MKQWVFISILALMAIIIAGCTNLPAPPPAQGQNPAGTLVTGPVVTLPVTTSVDIQVMQKDSVYSTVDVVFGGGNGQLQVSSCDVIFTRSDGTSESRKLQPEKGATITLQGTKGTDRVEVSVTMKDGKTYRVIDQLVPYRTRG
jgi:hypothetical protein